MPSNAHAEAFAAFVQARSASLLRTAYLLTGDHHRAEDLVQTALFKAARVWGRIDEHPEAYVRRIIYNENVSWWRRKRHRETELTDSPERPAAAGVDPDVRLSLMAALGRLTNRQRTIIVLRYYEDLTEAQTAAQLGISVGAVKSQHRQALGRLRAVAPDLEELLSVGGDTS